MERRVVLLRGINLGARNRVAMPELRELLAQAGHENVRTYVQSGNVVLDSNRAPDDLAQECERRLGERFGFAIPVLVRTPEEMAEVVERNPLGHLATDPKRYQVTFLSDELAPADIDALSALAGEDGELVVEGREVYAWHPDGVAVSKLARKLTQLKVKATARNWSTVEALLGMARE